MYKHTHIYIHSHTYTHTHTCVCFTIEVCDLFIWPKTQPLHALNKDFDIKEGPCNQSLSLTLFLILHKICCEIVFEVNKDVRF